MDRNLGPVKTHLFTPGPTPVPDRVLRELATPLIHHRSPQWRMVFGEVLAKLPRIFGCQEGQIGVLTSSGSGAMESAVANLVEPGDEIVVASFGRFGERWAKIAERYGATIHHHKTPLGERPNPQEIADFAAARPAARVIFTTQSETATGAVADAANIAAAVRRTCAPETLLVLDAISSLGAMPMRMDEWQYDVVVSGSQKALMVPPGLAMFGLSERALERARLVTTPRFYMDWPKTMDAHRKSPPSTPFTPASTLVMALNVALDILFEEGLDAVYERHIRLGRAVRSAVAALGLDLFSPDDDSSSVVTAVLAPSGVDGAKIPAQLREYGVTIAGGQDELAGKIFRIGHCGWVNELDIVLGVAALERGLAELGVDIPIGAGVAAAQKTLVSEPVAG